MYKFLFVLIMLLAFCGQWYILLWLFAMLLIMGIRHIWNVLDERFRK